MDYETKIYLEKLIEAIESPDIWVKINTIALAVIAWVQVRIQQQQKSMQMYEQYRQTYILLDAIENMADNLIISIAHYFSKESINLKDKDSPNFWKDKVALIDKLDSDFNNNESHIKMQMYQIGITNYGCLNYTLLLSSMRFLVDYIDKKINHNTFIIEELALNESLTKGKAYMIECIKNGLKDKNEEPLKSLDKQFQLFLSCRKSVVDAEVIPTIKRKCKIG